MKPHVTCHMAASVDGRTLHSRWSPNGKLASDLFERLHDELGGDAWLIGRVTGQEFAKTKEGTVYPAGGGRTFPREAWFSRRDAKAYGVVLDVHGKIVWGRSDSIGGDPIVVVCCRSPGVRCAPGGPAQRGSPTSSPAGPTSITGADPQGDPEPRAAG